jgi:DNA replication factor GINS
MILVRVLRGIPEFLGVDERKWHLGREDIVLLPRTNAQVLINQGAATEIKVKR